MKLISLEIDQYKNLSGTYDFNSQDGYIALIGENGSGKSNLLEAISLIFQGLYNKKGIPFDYTIKYQIGDSIYERGKNVAKKDGEKIKASEMTYPSSLIACYSGEDRRLWELAYKDYYYHYFNKAIKENYIIPNLLYIDKSCWEIALISLICEYDKPDINTFLNSLGITDIIDVNISFTIDEDKLNVFKQHDALSWFNSVIQDNKNVNAKTLATTEPNPTSAIAKRERKSKLIFQYLYLLSQPEHNEINKVQKLIRKIDIKLNDIGFEDLSEGEKKLILIECITKILGDKDSLLLLDEPDAHTHIARKKDLLKAIESFDGQTILTTHSPVFIDMMDFENLRYVEYGGIVDMDRIKAITKIADGRISILEGALIATSKKIIITEGPDDVKHIKAAILALANIDSQYEKLLNIPIAFQGGATLVEDYYTSVLEPVYDNLEKVIFVFDHDSGGRKGVKLINKLAKEKIKHLYYYGSYPIPENTHDFYLEDFYPRTVYPDIILPNINNEPSFYEMKKCGSLTTTVKERLQKLIDRGELKGEHFNGFSNFLKELIRIIDN